MSRNGSVSFDWGDGEHDFRLALGELRELQEKSGVSPFAISDRLRDGHPMVDDAREVLRLGLIGGGLKPIEALALVRRHVDERPLSEGTLPASLVLSAALFGVADEEPGKSEAETGEPPAPPTVD